MNYQSIVTPGSALLAVLALWKRQDLQQLWAAIATNQSGTPADWSVLGKDFLLAIGFVVVISLLAGMNPDTGKISLALLIVLWVLFAMNKVGGRTPEAAPPPLA